MSDQPVGPALLDEPPPPPPAQQAQVEIATDLVVALGWFPGGSPDPATIEIVDLTAEQWEAIQAAPPGELHLDDTGAITVVPPPPPPVQYDRSITVKAQVRTDTDMPLEVFRFPCKERHLYQASLTISGIDAGNFAVKLMEGRFVWKRISVDAIVVGLTVVSDIHNTAAASWLPNYHAAGADVVFTVQGAVGRTIDWLLAGEVGVFAPEGLA